MDQILDNFVGGHGKYQIAITIATSLINEFANGIFLMHIFTAYAPKHRCRVPQCETINATKVSLTRHTIKDSYTSQVLSLNIDLILWHTQLIVCAVNF